MAYSISVEDINSLSWIDLALSSSVFLPHYDDIPSNIQFTPYYDFVKCHFLGKHFELPFTYRMKVSPKQLCLLIDSHLTYAEIPLDIRLCSVAYIVSFVIQIEE